MPSSLFVHALEIRVPEQTNAAGKLAAPAEIRKRRGCHSVRERSQHASTQIANLPRIPEKGETLLTEAGLHRHPLAALGAPARNYRAAGLGLHPRKKSVRLRAVTTVGLECALGHEKSLLLMN